MVGAGEPPPRVSVIITVFNGAATVARAVESVLNQTFTDFELIVVDDGSTDATREVLSRYGGRARLVSQPNRGAAAARNAGIALSRGEYVAFLDADDTWRPEKLKKTAAALAASPEAVLSYSSFATVDERGAPVRSASRNRRRPCPLPSTMLVRRDALLAVGGFDEGFRRACGEDTYLALLLSEKGAFAYVPDELVFYQVVPFDRLPAKREQYRRDFQRLEHLVRRRYGRKHPLAHVYRRMQANGWAHLGKESLLAGERSQARHALWMALTYEPWRLRYVFRFMRTFLPTRLAIMLSRTRGRSGRSVRESG